MRDNNRIGSLCWYQEYDYKARCRLPWKVGYLRAWSTDHEEFETGPGHYPAAVIEDRDTGAMKSIHVQWVSMQPPEEWVRG